MNTAKQITLQKAKVISNLLPDLCTIQPSVGTGVVISEGIVTQTPASLRQYNGSSNIPCRMDIDRAFRPDKLKTQATTVDEYTLEIPTGIGEKAEDIITVRGRRFIVRKIKDVSEWDVTVELTVVEVSTDIDYGQSN